MLADNFENPFQSDVGAHWGGRKNHISRRAHAIVLETTEDEGPCNKGKESVKKISLTVPDTIEGELVDFGRT